MDYVLGLILGLVLGVFWTVIVYIQQDTTITPEKVSFAESSCKLGEWVSIDKNVITCNDGAVYKYNEEK